MKRPLLLKLLPSLIAVWLLAVARPATAQNFPATVTYQGRVAVGGTNFTGTGQFKFVLLPDNVTTSLWSHDGTSTAGSEPTSSLAVPVDRGLFYVALGDTNLPGMAPLTTTVFSQGATRLRVWFSDGIGPFAAFSPDHQLNAVPYAMLAATVRPGAIDAAALDGSVDARFVNTAGDTMTGALALPPDGLFVGTNQLAVIDGRIGIGTATPTAPLTVVGPTSAGAYIFETFSGTNRVGWARKKP
jgi:hypothetical protein